MENVVLILGSNLGDRKASLMEARTFIETNLGQVIAESAIYVSSAWGYEGKEYLNQVLVIASGLAPRLILELIKEYERSTGRQQRTDRYTDRRIDIDILYYGDYVISEPRITIPHRAIADRRFVLLPMCEIMPEYEHPVLRANHAELLVQCPDDGKCELWYDV